MRRDNGDLTRTKTRSEAELLGGHTPVVWLEGIVGAYALDRVMPVTQLKADRICREPGESDESWRARVRQFMNGPKCGFTEPRGG